jgi:YaaC-like Protein
MRSDENGIMAALNICRYEETEAIITHLDPLTDLVTWLEYYSAIDYVAAILTDRHGVPSTAARQRARLVAPHARLAREYFDQALSGPRDVSFLPIYYGILNLVKIYILFGPHHALLPANRWHGATYDGYGKASQTLLTEKITVKQGGAIPLFYQTLTGQQITRAKSLRLSEIYPYLLGVSIEYKLATGKAALLVDLHFQTVKLATQEHLAVSIALHKGAAMPRVHQLKALIGFKKHLSMPGGFIGRPISPRHPPRSHIKPYLIYHHVNGTAATRVCGSNFVFPEEFPIVLAFFHMSSVVRYKPEFLARLKDSKYWPLLSTARRHSLLQFLIAFWSFTHNSTLMINPWAIANRTI